MKKLDTSNREFYWIAVDIANTIAEAKDVNGNVIKLDKLPLDQRVSWVVENFNNLKQLAEEGESPYETQNALRALKQHIQGQRVNHLVYLDASNNALQLYAVLTADSRTANTCNIAGSTVMQDAYQMLADGMTPMLENYSRVNETKLVKVNRSKCKKALMTTMYGKADGSQEIIEKFYPHINDEHKRSMQFAEEFGMTYEVSDKTGNPSVKELKQIFQEAMLNIAPTAVRTMEMLVGINTELALPTYHWTLPDGFKVKCDIKRKRKTNKHVRAFENLPDIVVPEVEFEEYGKDMESRSLAPNIIHSVDGYVAREMIRRMDGRFITSIHDAFGCHPLDCDLMRQNFNEIMAELLQSNLLEDIVSEIMKTRVNLQKTNDLTKDMILASELALS